MSVPLAEYFTAEMGGALPEDGKRYETCMASVSVAVAANTLSAAPVVSEAKERTCQATGRLSSTRPAPPFAARRRDGS
jgi:hypothetical protein